MHEHHLRRASTGRSTTYLLAAWALAVGACKDEGATFSRAAEKYVGAPVDRLSMISSLEGERLGGESIGDIAFAPPKPQSLSCTLDRWLGFMAKAGTRPANSDQQGLFAFYDRTNCSASFWCGPEGDEAKGYRIFMMRGKEHIVSFPGFATAMAAMDAKLRGDDAKAEALQDALDALESSSKAFDDMPAGCLASETEQGLLRDLAMASRAVVGREYTDSLSLATWLYTPGQNTVMLAEPFKENHLGHIFQSNPVGLRALAHLFARIGQGADATAMIKRCETRFGAAQCSAAHIPSASENLLPMSLDRNCRNNYPESRRKELAELNGMCTQLGATVVFGDTPAMAEMRKLVVSRAMERPSRQIGRLRLKGPLGEFKVKSGLDAIRKNAVSCQAALPEKSAMDFEVEFDINAKGLAENLIVRCAFPEYEEARACLEKTVAQARFEKSKGEPTHVFFPISLKWGG